MAKCSTHKYGGLGECSALRDSAKGLIVCDKGTTISLANAAIIGTTSTTGWSSIIRPVIATSAYEKGAIIDLERGYEVTTEAAEMGTSNTGYAEQVGDQHPKMTAYGKMSYSEYMGWWAANGESKDIYIVLKNGNIIGTSDAAGLAGFRGRMFMKLGSIPKTGADLQKECEFMIYFDDPEQWENIVEVETEFKYTNLLDAAPVGLDAIVTTAYEGTGGTVTIKATKRNSNTPFAGVAAAANIQIIEANNDATCAVSSVAQGNAAIGSYVVTMTASLVGPVKARLTAESASLRTYVSKVFTIVE